MPDPPIIKTSLAERIAKLNAAHPPQVLAAGAVAAASPTNTSTPAPGQIKQKISKYELTGQGEAPLVPKGSFGLGAPMNKGDRNLDRMRIASLGVSGGLVPTTRSPSPGPVGRRASSCSSNGNGHGAPLDKSVSTASSSSSSTVSHFPTVAARSSSDVSSLHFQSLMKSTAPLHVGAKSQQPQDSDVLVNAANDAQLPTPPPERHNSFEAHVDDQPAPLQADNTRMTNRDISSFHGANDLDQDLSSMTLDETSSQSTESKHWDEGHTNGSAVNGSSPDVSPSVEEYSHHTDQSYASEIEGGHLSENKRKPLTQEEGSPELDSYGMPKVKCSSCGSGVSLMELSEHLCDSATSTSEAPAVVSAKPTTTITTATSAAPDYPKSISTENVNVIESPVTPKATVPPRRSSLATSTSMSSTPEFGVHQVRPLPRDVPLDLELDDDEEEELEDVDGLTCSSSHHHHTRTHQHQQQPQHLTPQTATRRRSSWKPHKADVPESVQPMTPDSPILYESVSLSHPHLSHPDNLPQDVITNPNDCGGTDYSATDDYHYHDYRGEGGLYEPRGRIKSPKQATASFRNSTASMTSTSSSVATTTSGTATSSTSATAKRTPGVWLDDEEEFDPSEGTGYATIVRSTRS